MVHSPEARRRAAPAVPSMIPKRSFDGSAAGKRKGRSGNYLFELKAQLDGRWGAPLRARA